MTLGAITYPTIVGLFLIDCIFAAINLTKTSKMPTTPPLTERMMSMAIRFTKGIVITVQAVLASMVAALLLPLKYSMSYYFSYYINVKRHHRTSSIVSSQNSNQYISVYINAVTIYSESKLTKLLTYPLNFDSILFSNIALIRRTQIIQIQKQPFFCST